MEHPGEFPLPQPSGATCPNCGAAQSAGTVRCSNCGAPMGAPSSSGLSPAMKTVASVLLALAALGLGAFGSCLGIIGLVSGLSPNDWTLYLLAIGSLVAAAVCVWAIFRINKRPR